MAGISIQEDIQNLQSAFDKLSKAIDKDAGLPPKMNILKSLTKPIEDGKLFMTDRQIAKRMMMMSGNIPYLNIPKVDEETAHLLIYGKLMYDSDGKLIDNEELYPDCVDPILAVSDQFPLKEKIRDMKLQLKNALKALDAKFDELTAAFKDAIIQIGIGFAAFLDAFTNIPKPQPSLAIAALLGILSNISKLQAKVAELSPLLAPLMYLIQLVPFDINNYKTPAPVKFLITFMEILTGLVGIIRNLSLPSFLFKETSDSAIESAKAQTQKNQDELAAERAASSSGSSGTGGKSGPTVQNNINIENAPALPGTSYIMELGGFYDNLIGKVLVTINNTRKTLNVNKWKSNDDLYNALVSAFSTEISAGQFNIINMTTYVLINSGGNLSVEVQGFLGQNPIKLTLIPPMITD